jgi:hypothetical protein
MDEYKHLFDEHMAYFTRHNGKKGPRGTDDDVFIIIYGTGNFGVLTKSDMDLLKWEDGDVEDFAGQANPFMDYMQIKILAYCNITKFLIEDSMELKEEFTKENIVKTREELHRFHRYDPW